MIKKRKCFLCKKRVGNDEWHSKVLSFQGRTEIVHRTCAAEIFNAIKDASHESYWDLDAEQYEFETTDIQKRFIKALWSYIKKNKDYQKRAFNIRKLEVFKSHFGQGYFFSGQVSTIYSKTTFNFHARLDNLKDYFRKKWDNINQKEVENTSLQSLSNDIVNSAVNFAKKIKMETEKEHRAAQKEIGKTLKGETKFDKRMKKLKPGQFIVE